MAFLSKLGNIINNQFGTGENTRKDFKIVGDKTAERTYIENGFIRNIRPRTRSVLFQQPDIYVVVKKRMFSSLINNSKLDVLEQKERLILAASKKLFQNKCKIISTYEKLTKIEKLTVESGSFNTYLGPEFLNLVDSLSVTGILGFDKSVLSAVDTLRKVLSYAPPSEYTAWTTNEWDASFANNVGEGPGTLELTNVSSITTRASVEWDGGSASLTLEDPYNILTITEQDIDQALADVTNLYQRGFFQTTINELKNVISELESELAIERRARNASNITFKINPGTVMSKKVRAILDDESMEIKFQHSNTSEIEEDSVGEVLGSIFSSVAGIITGGTVDIEPEFLKGNPSVNISESNQLTKSEQKKFSRIISNIFTLLNYNETSKAEVNRNNADVNYARNRMRLFFNGKYVIQPMDVVTIYMSSRTSEDDRLPGGFVKQQNESGYSLINRFDTILKNIGGLVSDIRATDKLLSFEDVERASVVGLEFPKWLWRQFKQEITRQPTGPCIFTGLVGAKGNGVSGTWNDGKWTVTVKCNDNASYFSLGYINFQPSAERLNASVYDPLTPFDISYDASTGMAITDVSEGNLPPLLPENKALVQSGLLFYQSGPGKGNQVTEDGLTNPTDELAFGKFRKVIHASNGLVYRWKQGIQTLTWNSVPSYSSEDARSVAVTQPFAGQDIMNMISILVTGQPYNYDTFLKAAIANGNSLGSNDSATNIPASLTYIQGLLTDIDKNNTMWGNFVPYKKLVMNPRLNRDISRHRLDLITANAQLTNLLRERESILDQLMLICNGQDVNNIISYNDAGQPSIRSDIQETFVREDADKCITKLNAIDNAINAGQSTYDDKYVTNQDVGVAIIGTDVNTNLTSVNDGSVSYIEQQRNELELRRNLARYTARRFWKVKANEDQNLFIVDDQYDKNLDLLAVERKITASMPLFDNPYFSISDQLNNVRKLLGFEVFANTQGHIEARPPGYNKIPSSVFYKMFKDRDEKGIKVFPDFLETLYFNQSKSLLDQIEILEDEIRLRAIALGAINDTQIINLILTGSGNGVFTATDFGFLSGFNTGITNIPNVLALAKPDYTDAINSDGLTSVAVAKEQLSTYQVKISNYAKQTRLFTLSTQISAIKDFNVTITSSADETDFRLEPFEQIRNKLRINTGKEPKSLNELFSNEEFRRKTSGTVSRLDRLSLFTQIGNLISQRQTLLCSLSNALNSFQDGMSLNAVSSNNEDIFNGGLNNLFKPSNTNSVARAITTPNLNRSTQIPELLEHMIEYENDDDLGVNSGKRFIITADRIVSLTISENAPPYTMVTVKGLFSEGFVEPESTFKNSFDGKNSSNLLSSAIAVDYDMWYQYGFKAPSVIEAPFLSDPDSQCAPFAYSTLLQARENILQGTLQISGYNEYYQPGDVIYIEDRGLLFYVRDVQHSFSYGSLATTLELSYGHNPGEYIPTMLDVVGKILYNAKGFTGTFRTSRHQMLGGARSLGALAIPNLSLTSEDEYSVNAKQELLSGSWGERNKNILTNILYSVSGNMNLVGSRRQKAIIKIVYYKTSESLAMAMNNYANAVFNWLVYPEKNTSEGLSTDLLSIQGNANTKSFGIDQDDIIIEEVDISNINEQTRRRVFPISNVESEPNTVSPSNAAFAVLRAISTSSNSSPENITSDQFLTLLSKYVLDLFIEYQNVEDTTT
jgi:hypothetical protein